MGLLMYACIYRLKIQRRFKGSLKDALQVACIEAIMYD